MAKKEEGSKIEPISRTSKKRKKKKSVWIGLIAVLLIGVVVWMNKESINRQVAKWTKDVPILNEVFKLEEEPYLELSKEELVEQIKGLEQQVKGFNEEIQKGKREQELLQQKIASLEIYEGRYTEFIEQKNKWDEEIAKTNPEIFIEQFEQIYPEQANQIYKELKQKEILTKEKKQYAKVIEEMDEERAAKALEKIVPTDPELVKLIFNGMQTERQGLVLSAMDSSIAAQTIKILSPNLEITKP